ncbi:MAG: hypothetical protein ABI416_03885 [Ginsengibacter sp.]
MSIDKVTLPAFLLPSMFGNNLVNLTGWSAPSPEKEEKGINFLGGNEKKIAFLFSDNQNKFLADSHVKFIYDLLTACQLTMADIALVNFFHNKSITYRELLTQLHPKKILMFGISGNELDLPFTIPFFQMQNFGEQVYMLSPRLDDLLPNKELKKQLWACLQKIFNIVMPK